MQPMCYNILVISCNCVLPEHTHTYKPVCACVCLCVSVCVCVCFILGGKRMRHIDFHFAIWTYPAPKNELQKETPNLPTNFAGMWNAICNMQYRTANIQSKRRGCLISPPMGGNILEYSIWQIPNCNWTKNNQRSLIIATTIQQIGIVSIVMLCLFSPHSLRLFLSSCVCVNHRVA